MIVLAAARDDDDDDEDSSGESANGSSGVRGVSVMEEKVCCVSRSSLGAMESGNMSDLMDTGMYPKLRRQEARCISDTVSPGGSRHA